MSQSGLSPNSRQHRFILMVGLLFLFFFQLLSDFVAGIYAFGLMGTGIPNEIVSVGFLFSPLLLLFVRQRVPTGWLAGLAWLGLVSRAIEINLETRGQMLLSGLGTAALLLFFSGVYSRISAEPRRFARDLTAGLLMAVLLSVMFRTLGAGLDITSVGMFRLITWLLALLAAALLWGWNQADLPESPEVPRIPTSRLVGLAIGITSVWLLVYFAFTSPNVIARWTGLPHQRVLGLLLVAWIAYLWWWLRFGTPRQDVVWKWAVLFSLALQLTILPHQVVFPASAGGYPLLEGPVAWWQHLPAYIMLLTSPVVLAAFASFSREIFTYHTSARQLGAAFGLAALYALLMIFGQVFTTVYDYIPVVGPFFRDKFWLVFLLLGLSMTLPVFLVKPKQGEERAPDSRFQWGMMLVAAGAFAALLILSPRPEPPQATAENLRVLTYNLQQGYDDAGQFNFDGQLAYIRAAAPDLLGIQETDTNRIANGNTDLVGYLARELNMYSYYGPKVVPGTFGIALLSRFPIEEARTYFLYSEGEQVAVIQARITIGDQTFTVYVNHLGNGGPLVQAEQFLQLTEDHENVIAMGDYNFRPYEEQYRRVTEKLVDVFEVTSLAVVPEDFDYAERIDHVFVSPGLQINLAQYLTETESDHPALLVEVGW